jgi:hypothetical protein
MTSAGATLGKRVWDLPPLILHPFNEKVPPSELLESSRAALMLTGFLEDNGADPDELERKVLAGRYTEVRMLYYIGKDVFRWMEQCVECLDRVQELHGAGIHEQSFAGFLTAAPPESVQAKLRAWGVADHQAIFARAIGIFSIFRQPPTFQSLAGHFLRNYHRCADHLFKCYMETMPHRPITTVNFHFDLYASGEYSKMLETEWGGEA